MVIIQNGELCDGSEQGHIKSLLITKYVNITKIQIVNAIWYVEIRSQISNLQTGFIVIWQPLLFIEQIKRDGVPFISLSTMSSTIIALFIS